MIDTFSRTRILALLLLLLAWDDGGFTYAQSPAAQEQTVADAAEVAPTSPVVTCCIPHAWQKWGRCHLKTGDVIFGMGDARACFGLLKFSKLVAKITHSRFSHTGIIVCEEGEPYVYDMAPGGPRRLAFHRYVIEDEVTAFAVRRPAPEFQEHIPVAVDYVRSIYRRGVAFDRKFDPSDECYYCTEMTEKAYRSAGLVLADAVPIGEFPRYHEYRRLFRLVKLVTGRGRRHRVFLPGNESIGIYSSPALVTVCECPDPAGLVVEFPVHPDPDLDVADNDLQPVHR